MPETTTALLNRLLARGKFRHVQVLLKLAELGSVQRTADAIGLTQSSVTQTLAYLEDLLGMPLFQRHSRGVRPTAVCTELLPVARRLLVGMSEAADAVTARGRKGGGVVRLLASASATNGVLIRLLPLFYQRHPHIEVHLSEVEGSDRLVTVARAEVDLVACRRPGVLPQGWEFHALADDRLAIICSADHPLRGRRRLDWAALGRETWLIAPAGSLARERYDELVARLSRPPNTHPLVTRLFHPLVSLIRNSRLLSLLPLSFVQHLVDSGELAILQVGEPIPLAPVGLLRPQEDMREAAAALSDFLCEASVRLNTP